MPINSLRRPSTQDADESFCSHIQGIWNTIRPARLHKKSALRFCPVLFLKRLQFPLYLAVFPGCTEVKENMLTLLLW